VLKSKKRYDRSIAQRRPKRSRSLPGGTLNIEPLNTLSCQKGSAKNSERLRALTVLLHPRGHRETETAGALHSDGLMEKRRLGSKNWISTDPRLRERLPLRLPTLPPQVAISGSLPQRLAAEERTAPSWSADRQRSH
jgi:hypothetical protein